MSTTILPPSSKTAKTLSDERREWVRIDDRVLLEYRLLTDPPEGPTLGLPPVSNEAITTAIAKPTSDLLLRSGEQLVQSPLLPWIMKVDWLLEIIVKTLAKMQPEGIAIAQVADVTLSGGGIGFLSPRKFSVDDMLRLKIILPPFTPIHTTARVIRSTLAKDGMQYDIASEYTDLSPDDQEHLIRHIIQTQAERLRARRSHAG
ncbi:MAG: PilZ domain-containing protein [Nitrospiraceae bacterium]|nr:MAG: PilZ domain-containing protein [Nitrospiraceae bacterium]